MVVGGGQKHKERGEWWMEGLDGVTNQHIHQQRCVWRAQPQNSGMAS